MLNYVWAFLIVISSIVSLLMGRTDILTSAIADCGKTSISLFLDIFGIIVLWSGLMNIAEKSGLTARLTKMLRPLIRLIFPQVKKGGEAEQYISLSLCAELMGLGNAGTPIGLRAMKAIAKEQGNSKTANHTMITFVVMNTASLQLIPTTVGALRSALGSTSPFIILPAVWIASFSAFAIGILSCKILERVWPT